MGSDQIGVPYLKYYALTTAIKFITKPEWSNCSVLVQEAVGADAAVITYRRHNVNCLHTNMLFFSVSRFITHVAR